MSTRPLGKWLIAALGLVAVVIAVDSSGLLSTDAAVVVDDSAQLFAGLAATIACWWTARNARGSERTWRRLMACGMGGWSIGQAFWSWYQIFSDTPLPSPSWADVGYLTMPVFALPALLVMAVEPPRHAIAVLHRISLVFVLDGLIIVGSLFILTWSTALGAVVRAGAPTGAAFAVAIAYPVTDLMLVVMVVLFAVTKRVPRQHVTQLRLFGLGLVGISASDSIFAYLVSSGADEMPPATNAGFIIGPLLIAVAALATADGQHTVGAHRAGRLIERGHLLLPYALVAVTGIVVAAQSMAGRRIDGVEATVAWLVLGLVLVRQIVTLIENTTLLERISATQAELAHRAQHDPLTGLPNRALFSERLLGAMERHRVYGRPYALLLVDLDDFKLINDSLGHAAGDWLLHAVAERLRNCVRSDDTVARLGGDEFAVVIEGVNEAPAIIGDRIVSALRHPFEIDGRLLALSGSVGVVEPGRDEVDITADALLQRADGAMYAGKRRGKGIAVRYDPTLLHDMPSPMPLPD
ncbi:MAG TPA: GGDEF domain-containing protein [Acidimicrobiales bacterium]|jgi:diguanylate cyclase (GGDEF)-like protein